MNREYRAFRRLFHFLNTVLFPLYRIRCIGKENIPQGPAIFCANHSSNFDPILMCLGIGIEHHPHYMAKIELFKIPVVSAVLRAIGTIQVDRGHNDINSIKSAMKYLRAGEKVGIFPEGTRIQTDDGSAKRGAVQIADQMSVPVIPVYIPRKKKPFHTYTIVVGTPYIVNPEHRKLSRSDYDALASALMENITSLKSLVNER